MPYSIRKDSGCPEGKPFAVVKNDDGKKMGCHESREKARRQLAAIYANEKKSK